MNINYLKYIVEIAEAGSINNAARRLGLSQPNLSRDIKDLEKELKITIFERTPYGMKLTTEGDLLIKYARGILKQIDDLEQAFVEDSTPKNVFSASVPRASYIGDAFVAFSNLNKDKEGLEFTYKETISNVAINDVKTAKFNIGIIRYFNNLDGYYEDMLNVAHMKAIGIARPQFEVFFSENSPLAKLDKICMNDLVNLTSVSYANASGQDGSLPISVMRRELPIDLKKRVFIYERATAFEILMQNSDTFMFNSTCPEPILKRLHILHKKVEDNSLEYVDVLFYRDNYTLTDLDKQFIECVKESAKNLIQ